MPASEPGACETAAVTVLYLPSAEDLAALSSLASEGRRVIAVINALRPGQRDMLPGDRGLTFIHNDRNVGLARALNQGLSAAMAAGARYVLMLDQDSRPLSSMLDRLAAAATAIEGAGRRLACVAPLLRDRKLASQEPIHGSVEISSMATFATSGTVITKRAWDQVGPMWDELFIDGIDHEWCFRARSLGFETIVVPTVVMEHDMGDLAINFFGRFKPVHRSPVRHYFIVRNTLWLARRGYIPLKWRLSELCKLAYRCPAYILISRDRKKSLINIIRSIVDGVRGPLGTAADPDTLS